MKSNFLPDSRGIKRGKAFVITPKFNQLRRTFVDRLPGTTNNRGKVFKICIHYFGRVILGSPSTRVHRLEINKTITTLTQMGLIKIMKLVKSLSSSSNNVGKLATSSTELGSRWLLLATTNTLPRLPV